RARRTADSRPHRSPTAPPTAPVAHTATLTASAYAIPTSTRRDFDTAITTPATDQRVEGCPPRSAPYGETRRSIFPAADQTPAPNRRARRDAPPEPHTAASKRRPIASPAESA